MDNAHNGQFATQAVLGLANPNVDHLKRPLIPFVGDLELISMCHFPGCAKPRLANFRHHVTPGRDSGTDNMLLAVPSITQPIVSIFLFSSSFKPALLTKYYVFLLFQNRNNIWKFPSLEERAVPFRGQTRANLSGGDFPYVHAPQSKSSPKAAMRNNSTAL
jgi:hypothetical protein